MKIAFLHLTMGLNNRGSEISTDIIASELSKGHKVLVVQGGLASKKTYQIKRPVRVRNSHKSAPQNIFEKIIFRLYLDKQSNLIKKFTEKSLKNLKQFNPDIIIPVNGKPQIQIIKRNFPNKKIAIFGRAGMGYHDRDSLGQGPNLFIALSKNSKTWAKKLKPKNTKISYIPNPVDISHFAKTNKAKTEIKSPTVLVVGALTKYKNIDLVIKAVAKTNFSLMILGAGEEKDYIQKLAKKLLPKRHVITTSAYEDLPSYYKSSDLFCFMPDAQEAFGRVYIEAMAAGLPIVASSDKIRKSIIGKNGIFVDHNPKQIAKAIEKNINKKPINYHKELEKFDKKNISDQIEKQLKKLLN
ncbi:glycosyltransferase family 4 protein [Patescibacteria group bacterium]